MEPYKLGTFKNEEWLANQYENSFSIEQTSGSQRLRITAKSNQIYLISDLLDFLGNPFGLLYVLVASRLGRESARYQSPEPGDKEQIKSFLKSFQDYLEKDGRHAVWLMALDNSGTIVYDQHDLIYAYGPLEKFIEHLESKNFTEGEIHIPSPHSHQYNPEFDSEEDRMMELWQWMKFDLVPDVDDP